MSRFLAVTLAALVVACGSSRSSGKPGSSPTAQAGSPSAPQLDPNAPVAKFDGGTVTGAELEEFVKSELRRIDAEHQQQVHDLRRRGVDALVEKRLVERKAKEAGLEPEAYVKREVLDKLAPTPSEQEMKLVYDQAKAGGRQLPPYEEVKGQIAQYLQGPQGQQARAELAYKTFNEKLAADAHAEVLLPAFTPPRVEVQAVGPAKGPENAPITIVEFSDFECPFCTRAEATVKQVLEAYPGKVRLVYRDFPLPSHHNAVKAAEAAHCAGDQGKYWEMHGKLFENQRALEPASLKGYAKDLGLDGAKFEKCLDSGEKTKVVEDHRKAGADVGVSGTPAFFINGMMLSGAQPLEAFKSLIDAELKNPQVAKK